MSQVIIVGGGLSGMSAAHTVLQAGGRTLLLDKSPFCGGNSTKATSGMNAAGTSTQRELKIDDSPEVFFNDTKVSAAEGARDDLIRVLTYESGPALEWLKEKFDLDLSIVARLAAHSNPRTHRGKERFPGMAITYGLMEAYEAICDKKDGRARLLNKATVTELIKDGDEVVGVVFEKGGKTYKEYGPVILCTGGFGADFSEDSLLAQVSDQFAEMEAWSTTSRAAKQSNGKKIPMPPLLTLPTTNGPHCTGDGIKMSLAAGGATRDLHCVQIHPTGIVDPNEPDAKVKFLAAEALRGSGGVILDQNGERFCDELGKRDYVSGRMFVHGKAPYRLCLNGKASALIQWHCDHYVQRGLMKKMTGKELAKEIGVAPEKLQKTFDKYNKGAESGNDEWDKKYFEALPLNVEDDTWHVAIITPLVHYCMGGIATSAEAEVITGNDAPIKGLFAGGEIIGGIHGTNRLGGSSLLDCVVYGRKAGQTASRFLLDKLVTSGGAGGKAGAFDLHVDPSSNSVTVSWGGKKGGASSNSEIPEDDGPKELDPNSAFYEQGGDSGSSSASAAPKTQAYTMDEIAKHTTKDDCWVILNDKVYDVTEFLENHPGGAKAILLYGGKDATEAFDMLHKPEIIPKYAAEYEIGTVAPNSKL
ncbi:Succinate dehydrogenase ubiquinone flavoprotein subunit, mitochondrial [Hondaea fermentalgiana]|uniref:fumarate reductase (NADH) n=1 Tax=Hondaea fermentalgiana TaxID=2315210 RepID=A0A2R5G4S6_9STRA|nr:Succinate dehydrogenase ubiquinone flavoprotein subunit, mitochondrial [Hondaea fermentalgiana]|eukprot:GBG24788.1 Succinate dehydrogenase ubiquinone flavoprotein subunit, mitochondrial [Hondaea fermentalgiana]